MLEHSPAITAVVRVITWTAPERLMAGSIGSAGMLDKGVIHVPGGMKWDSKVFRHAAQNIAQDL